MIIQVISVIALGIAITPRRTVPFHDQFNSDCRPVGKGHVAGQFEIPVIRE
jgi:hypothetical protein